MLPTRETGSTVKHEQRLKMTRRMIRNRSKEAILEANMLHWYAKIDEEDLQSFGEEGDEEETQSLGEKVIAWEEQNAISPQLSWTIPKSARVALHCTKFPSYATSSNHDEQGKTIQREIVPRNQNGS
jgi:Ni,Fe-hydrogenase III component G